MTWKQATANEIGMYYYNEFPERFSQIPEFIVGSEPKEIAVAFRDAYPVQGESIPPKQFIRRETFGKHDELTQWSGKQSIFKFIQNPAGHDPFDGDHALASPDVVDTRSLPEAVYFSADFVDRNWALIVDIDAKDVALERAEAGLSSDTSDKTNEEIKQKASVFDADPAGYPYAFEDIDRAIEYGFEVQDAFRDRLDTTDTMVVYSGQGCHVYLYDPDKMYRYSERNRRFIANWLTSDLGIPIDEPVTTDESRVIRLPYSLHAGVSRIVTPIYDANFDYREKATPEFLNGQ